MDLEITGNLRAVDVLTIKHFRKGKLIDSETKLIEQDVVEDLIVNKGLELYAKLVNGVETTPFKYIAIGIGTVSPSAGDTALGNEITTGGGARTLATCSYEADYKAKWVHTFNFTSSFAVTECGILDAASAGNMCCRYTFSAKNVDNGDSIEFTVKHTFSTS